MWHCSISVYEGAPLTPILRVGIIIDMADGDQYFTLKAQKVTFVEQANNVRSGRQFHHLGNNSKRPSKCITEYCGNNCDKTIFPCNIASPHCYVICYDNNLRNQCCTIALQYMLTQQGAVSIRKTVLPGMAIPMLKIRRPNGRLIFNMGIPIPGKDGLCIETGPRVFSLYLRHSVFGYHKNWLITANTQM